MPEIRRDKIEEQRAAPRRHISSRHQPTVSSSDRYRPNPSRDLQSATQSSTKQRKEKKPESSSGKVSKLAESSDSSDNEFTPKASREHVHKRNRRTSIDSSEAKYNASLCGPREHPAIMRVTRLQSHLAGHRPIKHLAGRTMTTILSNPTGETETKRDHTDQGQAKLLSVIGNDGTVRGGMSLGKSRGDPVSPCKGAAVHHTGHQAQAQVVRDRWYFMMVVSMRDHGTEASLLTVTMIGH